MAQTRQNKIVTITNDEAFDLATHLARMADSTNVIINVNSQAEADALTGKYAGMAVRRLDLGVEAVDVWTGSAWFGAVKPFGHMGRTNAFQGIQSVDTVVQMEAAQVLKGGMTFSNADDALVVPVSGYYRMIGQFYATGGLNASCAGAVQRNAVNTGIQTRFWKADSGDYMSSAMGTVLCNQNDKIRLVMTYSPSSTWGTDGYNGTFLEVQYLYAP